MPNQSPIDPVLRLFPKNSLETIRLAFFDMDHTLIDNDCDLSWKEYLVDKGLAGWTDRLRGRWHFWMYRLGRLNPVRFMRFQLAQFRGMTGEEMAPLLAEHFAGYVLPKLYPAVPAILADLRARGIPCILITATSREIAAPLAAPGDGRTLWRRNLRGMRPAALPEASRGSIVSGPTSSS